MHSFADWKNDDQMNWLRPYLSGKPVDLIPIKIDQILL